MRVLRRVYMRRAAYSSSAFVGADEQHNAREAERERLRAAHNDDDSSRNTTAATSTSTTAGAATAAASMPTAATYAAMSTAALQQLLQLRATQVEQLRRVYTHFHYEADKCYRHTVLDYHDKALQLSQVHGKMQLTSVQTSREVLKQLREEQERLNRDLRLGLAASVVVTVVFWVWVRRHYVRRSLYTGEDLTVEARALLAPSVTGAGGYGSGNPFSSAHRSARGRETDYEREVRERNSRGSSGGGGGGGDEGGAATRSM